MVHVYTYSMHKSQVKTPPDARILKIRDHEDRLSTIQNAVKVRMNCCIWSLSCSTSRTEVPVADAARWTHEFECLRGEACDANVFAHSHHNTAVPLYDEINHMCMSSQEDSKLGAAAAWEAKTDKRIQQNAMQQRFDAFRAQRAANLDERRRKLAQLLHEEEQTLKQELMNCQETPAQRRAGMAERAREMARIREAEREQLAAELKEQAFRDNCDPLKERYSRQIVYKTAQEQKHQVRAIQLMKASIHRFKTASNVPATICCA